jgi:hypothetical protein
MSWLTQLDPASGTVKKVIEINPYLLGTMAGGAGSYLFLSTVLLSIFSQPTVNSGRRILECNADCTSYETRNESLSLLQANISAISVIATRVWT